VPWTNIHRAKGGLTSDALGGVAAQRTGGAAIRLAAEKGPNRPMQRAPIGPSRSRDDTQMMDGKLLERFAVYEFFFSSCFE